MSSNSFITKMKSLGDELAAAGRPVTDGEIVDYILAGLDQDYDPIVATVGCNAPRPELQLPSRVSSFRRVFYLCLPFYFCIASCHHAVIS